MLFAIRRAQARLTNIISLLSFLKQPMASFSAFSHQLGSYQLECFLYVSLHVKLFVVRESAKPSFVEHSFHFSEGVLDRIELRAVSDIHAFGYPSLLADLSQSESPVASQVIHIQHEGFVIHPFAQLYHVVLKAISVDRFFLYLEVNEASLCGYRCHSGDVLQGKLRLIDSDVTLERAPALLLDRSLAEASLILIYDLFSSIFSCLEHV